MRRVLLFLLLNHLLFSPYCQSYLIENVNLIPLTSEEIFNGINVHVFDGQIVQVSPEIIEVNVETEKIDGSGKYLMPGLIDCYVHINKENLALFVANGITTVRNAPGQLFQHALKERVMKGEIIGPGIYSASPPIAGSRPFYHSQGLITKLEDVNLALRDIQMQGYDAVFVYATIDLPYYQRLIDVSTNLGLKIEGHVPYMVDPGIRMDGPQRSFENLVSIINTSTGKSYYPGTYLPIFGEQLASRKKIVIPSLTIHKIRSLTAKQDSLKGSEIMKYISPRQLAYWKLKAPSYVYGDARNVVKVLHESDVTILVGTDAGFPFVVPGFSYHDELKNLKEAGMDNWDLLKAATIDAATFLQLDDRGTLEEDKRADMIMLNKNPIEDIENLASLDRVFLKGKMIDRSGIKLMLDRVEKGFSNLSSTRFNDVQEPGKPYSLVAEYEIFYRQTQIGEERIYSSEDKKRWLTQNTIDPMRPTISEMEWTFGSNNELVGMSLRKKGDEGEIRVDYNSVKKELKYALPIYGEGDFAIVNDSADDLILGPNCSINADMDLVANYQMLINRHYSKAKDSLTVSLLRVELNSEEWGANHIGGTADYIIKQVDRSNFPGKLVVIQPGYNNVRQYSFKAAIEVDNELLIRQISFDDGSILVKRKK